MKEDDNTYLGRKFAVKGCTSLGVGTCREVRKDTMHPMSPPKRVRIDFADGSRVWCSSGQLINQETIS